MKKRYYGVIFLICSIFTCGCAGNDSGVMGFYKQYVEDRMLVKSGVNAENDYVLTTSLEQSGMLDENGNYKGDIENLDIDADILDMNPISFSVCTNNGISFDCYRDQNLEERINEGCKLSPGDCIYISNIVCNSSYTDCYELDRIKLVDYKEDGTENEVIEEISAYYINDNETQMLHIPDDYNGTDLVLEILGRYYDREINLNANWKDTQGGEHNIDGIWKVNDEVVDGGICAIEPSIDYKVSFSFDKDFYYFSGNKSYYFRVEDDYIEFYKQNSIGGTRDFSVDLKKYNIVEIDDTYKAIVSIDVSGESLGVGKTSYEISQVKAGEWITFKVKPGYKVSCKSIDLYQYEKTDGYKFNGQIPENSGENIAFVIEKWNSKEVEVVLDKNNVIASFFIGIGNFFSGIFGGNKPEDSLLYIQCGDNYYTYADIQANSKIKISENEKLKLVINKDKLNGVKIVIIFNGNETYFVNESSLKFEFDYNYEDINEISIEGEE